MAFENGRSAFALSSMVPIGLLETSEVSFWYSSARLFQSSPVWFCSPAILCLCSCLQCNDSRRKCRSIFRCSRSLRILVGFCPAVEMLVYLVRTGLTIVLDLLKIYVVHRKHSNACFILRRLFKTETSKSPEFHSRNSCEAGRLSIKAFINVQIYLAMVDLLLQYFSRPCNQ